MNYAGIKTENYLIDGILYPEMFREFIADLHELVFRGLQSKYPITVEFMIELSLRTADSGLDAIINQAIRIRNAIDLI